VAWASILNRKALNNAMPQPTDFIQKFSRIGLITILAVYLLIFVGGVVRASGSGMGCPDWPTCFGKLIPPTQESELPADYHQKYIGYGDTTFNPVKTWTEYLNRLLGVSIGLLILTTLIRAIPFRKTDPVVFNLSLGVFLLVGFQGWLGSRVVASELKPSLISAHMIVALLIVSLLISTISRSRRDWFTAMDISQLPLQWRKIMMFAIGFTLLQVAMGTQIREAVDGITNAREIAERNIWREHFPIIFYVHRSFSSIILFTNLWLVWRLLRAAAPGQLLRRLGIGLATLIVIAILTGVTLDRLGFPALVQPFHLLLANLIFGCQLFLLIGSGYALEAGMRKHASPA
jgi:cytochrome c oxidase assembly protein subunit 15